MVRKSNIDMLNRKIYSYLRNFFEMEKKALEQPLVDELCIDLCTFLCGSFPGRNILVIIFEGAVADEFGIESAVSSVVDILEEDTI